MAEPTDTAETGGRWGPAVLLAAIFSAAACAIIYELLISSTSAYFLGDSVAQFSITIGLFLASMGLGSWLSRAVDDERLLERFIAFELWLAAVGRSSWSSTGRAPRISTCSSPWAPSSASSCRC